MKLIIIKSIPKPGSKKTKGKPINNNIKIAGKLDLILLTIPFWISFQLKPILKPIITF